MILQNIKKYIGLANNKKPECLGNFMNVKKFGVKKTFNGYWTYAEKEDCSVYWATKHFTTKQEAEDFINKLASEYKWI
jgi:hypothetical protein